MRSCYQTLEIQSDGKSSREALILLKNSIKGFQKLLINILLLEIQNGGYNMAIKSRRIA